MIEFTQYAGRFQGFRGQIGGLPQWARVIVLIFAIPGLALAFLSILGLLVSILALLVLTAPVYVLLKKWTSPAVEVSIDPRVNEVNEGPSPGVKRVQSSVVD